MVIALDEVADESLVSRAVILVVVALRITLLVYGVVTLIVKMDDVGLRLARTRHGVVAATGRLLVRAMPKVLAVLSGVGIVAMLWVGGHILRVGVGGFLAWLTSTLASALVGLIVGAVVVAVLHLLRRRTRADVAH